VVSAIFASLQRIAMTVEFFLFMLPPKMSFHLKLALPSDPRFLSVVRAALGELGVIYGLPNEQCLEVTLAVDEALANVIRHAYGNCSDRKIEFECLVNEEQMEFTLLDQGEPPDPAKICGQPLDEFALSGRGTHLIKAIMDEVSYKKVSGGNQLKLIKRLPGPEAHAEREQSRKASEDESTSGV
jgi:anti-sigma regulatory factor (Ser/Thr protein kinase)